MDTGDKWLLRIFGAAAGFCVAGPVGAYAGYKVVAVGTALAAGQGGMAALQAIPFVGGIADGISLVADVSDGISTTSDFADAASTTTDLASGGADLTAVSGVNADASELGLKYPPSSYEDVADTGTFADKSELASNIQGNPEDLNGHGIRPADIQGNDWGRNGQGNGPQDWYGNPRPA